MGKREKDRERQHTPEQTQYQTEFRFEEQTEFLALAFSSKSFKPEQVEDSSI